MYKYVEFVENLEAEDVQIEGRVGEDVDDMSLKVGCQTIAVSKKDVRRIQRILKALMKEAT